VKRVALAAATAALFLVFLVLLFPTDAVVGRGLAALSWPGLGVGHAALRPYGILLDDVTLRDAAGKLVLRADRVRLRPSAWSLVRGGNGLPWRIDGTVCEGAALATVAEDGTATEIAVTWDEGNLAACPPLAIAGGALEGSARGAARLRFAPDAAAQGDGRVELSGAVWHGAGPFAAVGALHAETASVRWWLHDEVVEIQDIALAGPELTASGAGEVRLAEPVTDSDVQLRMALTPAPGASGPIQFFLPPSLGTRQLVVNGRLASPQVMLQ
jgi:type II secretion system protein N